jgi:hypothetical protein
LVEVVAQRNTGSDAEADTLKRHETDETVNSMKEDAEGCDD